MDEYNLWWSLEYHKITYLLLTFVTEMIKKKNIFDLEPDNPSAVPVTFETKIVATWLESEKVKFTKLD